MEIKKDLIDEKSVGSIDHYHMVLSFEKDRNLHQWLRAHLVQSQHLIFWYIDLSFR